MNVKNDISLEKGVINRGNLVRLKKRMQDAKEGKSLVIGFIGGSITQGSLASSPQTCYAYQVFCWWKENFLQADFQYVNAGIGGTTSQFGVARAEEDLLCRKPDVVIVEFSVNDDNNEHFAETYEGLIRKIYGSEKRPAVILVHNVRYDDGISAQEQHLKIGKAYELPCISMKTTIYPKVTDGSIPVRDITPDDLHPNDKGHQLVSAVIIDFLRKTLEEADDLEEAVGAELLPSPVTRNPYENSIRYRNDNYRAVCNGFTADMKGISNVFQKGWMADKVNDSIVFRIRETEIAIQYRKSMHKPAPIARVVIDGDLENAVFLDGNFDESWGDCIYIETIASQLDYKEHTIEVTIVESGEVAVPFYLVSVIGSH